jgi:hypothetical protein
MIIAVSPQFISLAFLQLNDLPGFSGGWLRSDTEFLICCDLNWECLYFLTIFRASATAGYEVTLSLQSAVT